MEETKFEITELYKSLYQAIEEKDLNYVYRVVLKICRHETFSKKYYKKHEAIKKFVNTVYGTLINTGDTQDLNSLDVKVRANLFVLAKHLEDILLTNEDAKSDKEYFFNEGIEHMDNELKEKFINDSSLDKVLDVQLLENNVDTLTLIDEIISEEVLIEIPMTLEEFYQSQYRNKLYQGDLQLFLILISRLEVLNEFINNYKSLNFDAETCRIEYKILMRQYNVIWKDYKFHIKD